jgi:general secretion pathway protein K
MELFYRSIYRGQTVELEGKEVWKADGAPHTEQFGEGYYTVRITDEAGKVDINTASEVVLKNLLTNGGIGEEEADIIVDSIMDWKDPDDLHRLHGAESDYYRSLPNPYDAKNAEFSTVEELIMVKGITPQLLYGSAGKKGLIEFLTVHAKKARINVKSAPKEVLLAVPGMTPEAADEIIALRSTKELTLADVVGILSGNAAEALRYIEADDSGVFTIDGTGGKTGEKGVYGIRATVSISEMNKYSYLYYKVPATIQE